MRNHNALRAVTAAVLTIAGVALGRSDAQAQLAEASASTLALSGAHTATASGFAALSVNPAGLAGTGFSLALVPVQARAGIGPITLSDLHEYEGVLVPDAVKADWLTAITAAGGQSGVGGADVSGLALTVGSFGLQISSTLGTEFNLSPGIAEALLYGNAGRTGEAVDVDLSDLGVEAFAATTAAIGYGFPVGPGRVGVTGKYIIGHGLGLASTSGSFSTDPLRVSLETPMVGPCDDELLGQCTGSAGNNGSGVGFDVGFMMDLPALRVGATVNNLINTFAWDVSTLSYRPGTTLVEEGLSSSNFDEADYEGAPAELKAWVDDYTFKPELRVGAAMDLPSRVTVSGDIRHRISEEGIAIGPRSHLALGAEWRALRFLHLRAGGALVSGGTQYSGGTSLVLGPVNLSAAAAVRNGDTIGQTTMAQFTLSFGNR